MTPIYLYLLITLNFIVSSYTTSVWRSAEPLQVFGDIPPPRIANSIVSYQEGDKSKLLIFGGTTYFKDNSRPDGTVMSDVYKFDIQTSTWTQTVPNIINNTDEWHGFASPRCLHSAVVIPSDANSPWRNTMIVYGGDMDYRSYFLVAYNLTTDSWVPMNETGLPVSSLYDPLGVFRRIGHVAVYSKRTNAMYIYGGSQTALATVLEDMWRFNLNNLTWQLVVPKNQSLPRLCLPGYTISIDGKWLYFYSGSPLFIIPPPTSSRDLYRMDLESYELQLISVSSIADTPWGLEMTYVPGTGGDSNGDRLWVWSFQVYDAATTERTTRFFQYDITTDKWLVDPVQNNPSRGRYWAKSTLLYNTTLYYTFGSAYYRNTTDNIVYPEYTNWISTIDFGTAIPPIESSADSSKKKSKRSSSVVGLAVGIPLGIVFLIGGIVAVVLFVRSKRQKREMMFQMDDVTSSSDDNMIVVTDIVIKERLGGGVSSDVYRGLLQGVTPVACKRLKDSNALQEFIREAKTLQLLKHPNVVQFLGVFTEPSTSHKYIVTEYLSLGSVRDLLLAKKLAGIELNTKILLGMCQDAAAGVLYITEIHHLVHRDLALRNLLVSEKEGGEYIVKVGDVGSSRTTGNKEFYKQSNDTPLPLRWLAPESILRREFNVQTDVWSFGVVLYELFSYGATPYEEYSNNEAAEKVLAGYRLTAPPNMPKQLADLMTQCFLVDPSERPSFKDIFATINNIYKGHAV